MRIVWSDPEKPADCTIEASAPVPTRIRTLSAAAVALVMLGLASQVQAVDNLTVSATVTSSGNCRIFSVAPISFGSLDPLNPIDVQATGEIEVDCAGNDPNFTLAVSVVDTLPLYLEKGPDKIEYALDLPAVRTVNLKASKKITIPVTAAIDGEHYRTAPPGLYEDTVTVMITP